MLRRCNVARQAGERGLWTGPALAPVKAPVPMPFEIHDEGGFYFARLFGVLDHTDLNGMLAEIERLEDVVVKDRLTDLTGVERVDVGFEEVFAVAMKRAQRQIPSPIRSAIVAAKPVHYGFARMFQMLNDNPRVLIRIFGTLPEAQQWLRASRR
jgi:hypothetical protein